MTNYFFDQRFLHGGDYNPDQWLDYPEILKKDLAYMQKAHVNTVTLWGVCLERFGANRRGLSV